MIKGKNIGRVALIGCGRLGSAILEGWLDAGAPSPADLIVLTRSAPPPVALAAQQRGASLNPTPEALADASTVVLAVKPAQWRDALAPLTPHLAPGAVIVSVMAGVGADLVSAAAARSVARLMPTTAVAARRGAAAVWSDDPTALARAEALFAPLADLTRLDSEDQMDPATALVGSGPAFLYAWVQALADAGRDAGLSPEQAQRLAIGALSSAAAGLSEGDLAAAIARIASPGGTTQAGLDAGASAGLDQVARAVIGAAVARAKTL